MNAVTKVARSIATVGPRRTIQLVRSRVRPSGSASQPVQIPRRMFQEVDWTAQRGFHTHPRTVPDGPSRIAWITSPPSPASGGHQNIFRFIKAFEDAGHECTLYFWDWQGSRVDGQRMREMLEPITAYPDLKARFLPYEGAVEADADAIIATAWETAYASFLDPSDARRFYFVQDYEPWFYPAGPNAILAENTYRFGFHGLTAGGWLEAYLRDGFGMPTDHFDFAADAETYRPLHQESRPGIFFYARRETPRRAFELGARILELVHERLPDAPIHFAGTDVGRDQVPFPFINHGGVDLVHLNEIYNECSAALVLSLSNLSLLPLELISAGVTPVVNDAPHNRMVSDNPHIVYAPLVAERMASAIVEAATRKRPPGDLQAMHESAAEFTWAQAGSQCVGAFERAMRGESVDRAV